ncbi:MAG: T9SS type A sorting domain-containing protein [Ferruginibacter sp.]
MKKSASFPSITGNGVNQQYSFIDANPLPGKNYYRIKEVNQSSGYTFSLIKSLLFNPVSPGWRIYPVPAKNDITIVNSASVDNVTLQLYDATGRLVYESELGQTSAGQQIIIAMNRFAKGIYTLKIISYNGLKEERILLE